MEIDELAPVADDGPVMVGAVESGGVNVVRFKLVVGTMMKELCPV